MLCFRNSHEKAKTAGINEPYVPLSSILFTLVDPRGKRFPHLMLYAVVFFPAIDDLKIDHRYANEGR